MRARSAEKVHAGLGIDDTRIASETATEYPQAGSSGVVSCKPAFAIAAILIWIFFAAVLWLNYLRKPPKD